MRFCVSLLLLFIGQTYAAGLSVWSLETRIDTQTQESATLQVLVDEPDKVSAVLIDMGAGDTKSVFKQGTKGLEYTTTRLPFRSIRNELLNAGIALLSPSPPSDLPRGWNSRNREQLEHREDLKTIIAAARKKFPAAPTFIAGYADSAHSVMTAALGKFNDVAGYVLIGGYFMPFRDEKLEAIKTPGLML